MLKRLLNIRKSNKPEEREELGLENLYNGCILDLDLESWEVVEVTEYDWGNNHWSREYKITNGKLFKYLGIDDGEVSLSSYVPINSVSSTLKAHIAENDEPFKQFVYEGLAYSLDFEGQGYAYENNDKDGSEFVSWDFVDQNETTFVTIQRWGEWDIEAYFGKTIPAHSISNLLPGRK